MSIKFISAEELGVELEKMVSEYTEDVQEAIEDEIDKTAELMLKDIRGSTAWTDRTKGAKGYRKGFKVKKGDKFGYATRTIYNKNKPGLVHLLELGHAKAKGGRVSARPHLRLAFDKHAPQMEKNIEEIIKKGGK